MIERRVVRRYAAALFIAASKQGVVDRIESDLGLIAYVMETSPDLLNAVSSPLIAIDTKKAILHDVFSSRVDSITMNFINLLVDKRREEALLETESEYVLLANEARGILNAEVRTAVKLNDEQTQALVSRLQSLTGKKIHLVKTVDSGLIAGVMVRIGDQIIDGSVKGHLTQLRKKLLTKE